MTVHHSGKSYDTSNGLERSPAASLSPQDAGGLGRRADDGAAPLCPVPVAAAKPAWSILGLRALNAAIARSRRTHGPAWADRCRSVWEGN